MSDPDLSTGGAWIPPWALRHPDLSDPAKILVGRLKSLSTAEGYAFPSNNYLARDLGVSVRQLQRYLAELKDHGLIRSEVKRHPRGTERRLYVVAPGRTEPPKGGRQMRHGGATDPSGGGDESVTCSFSSEYKSKSNDVEEYTSKIQDDLLPEGEPNGSDPLEGVVEAVWEKTLEAWKERVGDQPGPDLKPTDGRLSKIRARARECLQAGMQPSEVIRYLELAARGLYADDWEGRDNYLDPKYAFKDDETVRGWVREGRKNEAGLSEADMKFARTYRRLMKREAEREDTG
ncbi:MAG: helix-turn-helix domain-containing protein [Gemmatimonadota bacterium]